ncbi:hypothetical protein PCL_09505 [Purpureocillium lilacinum]|uniref:CHAT domain-containing protein n=1 Tax=Purpureocillium lilacinum TaxID=33203 RepID=A0A2U3DQT5_PURLI|nr:hypothetical protein PCL_09505 [Purpureocillium lilacinum]
MGDLEEAIEVGRRASSAMPDNLPDRTIWLFRLRSVLQSRYERTGAMGDLEKAVEVAREAVAAIPDGNPGYAGALNELGNILETRYERTGAIGDLEEAVEVAREAIAVMPHEQSIRAILLSNLGSRLQSRYERTGAMTDLEEAIVVARRAIAVMPREQPIQGALLSRLGSGLRCRYERTGVIGDLDEATEAARQAIIATPSDHPCRASWLNNLGTILACRYQRTGRLADLEEAIEMAREAVAATPDYHSDRAIWLMNLGPMLQSRYERTGALGNLEEAVKVARETVAEIPDNHPDCADALNRLGIILVRRYERTGAMTDLEEAIVLARQAVASIPDDHPDRAGRVNNLAITLFSRYKRTGAMGDLQEAIQLARELVATTPDHHSDYATWLKTLGPLLQSQYERTGVMDDLNEAIVVARQAVSAISDDHADRPSRLANLGAMLAKTGAINDLEEAIVLTRQAIAAISDDHPHKSDWLNNLGTLLHRRYSRTRNVVDLDEAIEAAQQVVAAIPNDHPDRAGRLNNLGIMLQSRYELNGAGNDLCNASTAFYGAWDTLTAVPFDRIRAAAWCMKLLSRQGKTESATQLGKEAIDLLPVVFTKLLDRDDQQHVISIFAGIAADLCALLLARNQVEDALQCLEQGRTVILGQLIDSRSDITNLAQKHSEIASRYKELCASVNSHINNLEKGAAREQAFQQRCESMLELDACIQNIRTIPGHERFLLCQTTREIQDCAAGGTIVVVNITEIRSDAILISPTMVKAINLCGLSVSEAKDWLGKDWTGRRPLRATKNREYTAYLAWLWTSCVKQILDELAASLKPPVDEMLRIWWIGSGLAGSMPFHAAGVHAAQTTETAYHLAVSSYIPSIKALAHAQKQVQDTETTSDSLLVVTMPTTPPKGQIVMQTLPGALEERKSLIELTKGHLSAVDMEHPDINDVVNGLRQCCIAHFACHGVTDSWDPSNSGLILQRRQEGCPLGSKGCDGGAAVQDRLTVKRVSELNLTHSRMAYLSACSTAQNKADRLSDEVIHVVSGFQVAGFPHVVGCLWPSNDRVCVEVASRLYAQIFRQFQSPWKDGHVAAALRQAVMAVRAEDIAMPLNWAQFVHYGP